MDLAAIPVFVHIVECGTLVGAAERLGITKSAVSKRLSQLEAHLGTKLLHRSTRKLQLTEAGQVYYQYARQAFEAAKAGTEAINEHQDVPKGTLNIALPTGFGHRHVAPVLDEFLDQNPYIKVNLLLDDRMVDYQQHNIDVGIRIGHLPDSSLIAKRLAPCLSVICASPHYLNQHGLPKTPKDLNNHNCLDYSYYQGGPEWLFYGKDGVQGVKPQGNFCANNSEAIKAAAIKGLGIAQLSTNLASEELASGQLVPILLDYPLAKLSVYAIYHDRQHRPAKVTQFLTFLQNKIGADMPYWDKPLIKLLSLNES